VSEFDLAGLLAAGFGRATPSWLYLVRSGVKPGTPVEEFERWYDEVHLPRILAVPGFLWASRYRGGGTEGREPHFVAIYAVDGPEALESSEYRALPGLEHWRDSVIDWTRGLYRLQDDLGHRDR
jgi:hypothetical protein